MIHQFAPVAAAIAANHCAALRGRCTVPAALVPLLGQLGERLAPALQQDLAGFCGTRPQVRSLGVETITEAELAERIGPMAGNALQAIAGGEHRLLVSIDTHAVLAQLDRTFGGDGDIADPLPATLPMSADLLSARLEQLVADSLQAALPDGCGLACVDRNLRYALLAPFDAVAELALLTLAIEQAPARSWQVRFAVPFAGLPDLLDRRRSAPRNAIARAPADPRARPFAEVPLTLEATLIDMTVPLSRLARLEPGSVLPVGVSRNVPLRIGAAIIARGTIGECDDRIALQITHSPLSGATQP